MRRGLFVIVLLVGAAWLGCGGDDEAAWCDEVLAALMQGPVVDERA